jgi:hypothetical protein
MQTLSFKWVLCKCIFMPVYCDISLYIRSWFFKKISRKEAEKLLLAEENVRGTFLVRCSEHNPQGYSLSVKDWEETRGHHVKHYKIKPLDNGGYYIATNQTFSTLQALVLAYTSECWKQIVFVYLLFCLTHYLVIIYVLDILVWYISHVTASL